jgi:hypothetical protein
MTLGFRWRQFRRQWLDKPHTPDADELKRQADVRRLAAQALVDAGAIEHCTRHDTYFGDAAYWELELVPNAIRQARAKIDAGTVKLPDNTPFREFMATMVGVADEACFYKSCPDCDAQGVKPDAAPSH